MVENKIEKLEEVEYNEQITLSIVENDTDLRNIFLEETNLKSFIVIRHLINENKLKEESRDFLRMIFNHIISTKQSFLSQYKELLNNGSFIKIEEPSIIPTSNNKKELPRRYGREAILKDIEKQGGKPTNVQLTALSANDLKNLWVNISNRLIKDMFSDDEKLTDEEYRIIRSTIVLLERKIKPIIKKK